MQDKRKAAPLARRFAKPVASIQCSESELECPSSMHSDLIRKGGYMHAVFYFVGWISAQCPRGEQPNLRVLGRARVEPRMRTSVGADDNLWQRGCATKCLSAGGFVMTIDRVVMRFAGTLVLLGLALGWYVNESWYWLSAFVGFNLLQSSFTGFCPLARMLKRLGLKPGAAF